MNMFGRGIELKRHSRRIWSHWPLRRLANSPPFVKAYWKPFQEWADRQYAAPSPNFIKHAVLMRNGAPNATWIETGTYRGDTAEILSKRASLIFTIEPDPDLFAAAEHRFKRTPNVTPIQGLSEDVLPQILESVSGDINFWLDGHYSGGITFKGPADTPIMAELSTISENMRKFGRVTILIDDVRCFDPGNPEYSTYPAIDALVDWARDNSLHWHIEHDIFVARNF